MKRNRFGINLDEGIPLSTAFDYESLYIEFFSDTELKLSEWVEHGTASLLAGGQIGSGKTTLINKVLHNTAAKPDVVLHFDKETLNLDAGDFGAIALEGLLSAALDNGLDLNFCDLPREIGGYKSQDWSGFLYGLRPTSFSLDAFTQKLLLRQRIAHEHKYVLMISEEIGKRLKNIFGRPLFIFASGLDKFDTTSAAFVAAHDTINVLKSFKTLFEVNAVHLFTSTSSPFYGIEPLLIPTAEHTHIVSMLEKRLGVYGKKYQKENDLLAEWSGGNPRQAIRLLTHFNAKRKNNKLSNYECIVAAVCETTSDLFAFAPRPSATLLKTISQQGYVEGGLFLLPGDKETARRALYGNWIFLHGLKREGIWNTSINPLVKGSVYKTIPPKDPEMHLLGEYAKATGISPTGLGPARLYAAGDAKSGEEMLWECLSSGLEKPMHVNLTETLDILGSALLSADRDDRAILAFKDEGVAEAVRAYFFAKANTYEYQRCSHIAIEGQKGTNPLQKLDVFISRDDTDVFSIEFVGKWDDSYIEILDSHRDRLVGYQLLFWIPFSLLGAYLSKWTQLRQLFEVYVLEDELTKSLTIKEIEADIAYFQDLDLEENPGRNNVIENLRVVLQYLQLQQDATYAP